MVTMKLLNIVRRGEKLFASREELLPKDGDVTFWPGSYVLSLELLNCLMRIPVALAMLS